MAKQLCRSGNVFDTIGIGAYDAVGHGGVYIIPGRKTWQASTPIPPNEAVDVKLDADLMFLPVYGATGHRVFADCSRDRVQLAADWAAAVDAPASLLGEANVHAINDTALVRRNATVFWRVDAVMPSGATHTGAVWSFTLEPPPPTDAAAAHGPA